MTRTRKLIPPSVAVDPRPVPLLWWKGSYLAGNAATIPDGYARLIENMLIRPGPRLDARPPFKYDSLMNISGLMRFEDLVNSQTRFCALDTSRNLYVKAASGETWSSAITGTLTASRVTGHANYRGKVYYMMDDGAGFPTAAAVFDGTNISPTPFNSPIVSRTITAFIDRLILAYPRVTVTPLTVGASGITGMYDFGIPGWNKSAVSASNITSGGVTISRLLPTSTTAAFTAYFSFGVVNVGPASFSAAATKRNAMWRSDLRNTHATYKMPITMEWFLVTNWQVATAYVVGDLISDGTSRQRCTTAGTSGGGTPAWNATLGGTTTDNTVTWTNEGREVVASREMYLPTATESPNFNTYFLTMTAPRATNTTQYAPRLKFFNTSTPTITLATVEVSLRDGLADGDPAKKNYGQQLTIGDYYFPFFNTETATSATINLEAIVWSETSDPEAIRGANNFEPKEIAGHATGARVHSGRYFMFKRRGMWQFIGTDDPDNPLLPERLPRAIGLLGSLAIDDDGDDEMFWISENDGYRMKGLDDPKPFFGDGMREEILANGSNWVPSQATYNRPLLAVDRKNREVWVYTQKGKLYCCHLRYDGAWTRHTTPNGAEVNALAYNPTTQRMYVAYGGQGLCRLDESLTQQDELNNTATTYAGTKSLVLKPFELATPRAELCLHEVGLYHIATYTQAGEALYAYVSFDRGVTYPKYDEVRFDPTKDRISLGLYQSGVTATAKIDHVGSLGAAAWALSGGEAYLELLAGEWPLSLPTTIASSL